MLSLGHPVFHILFDFNLTHHLLKGRLNREIVLFGSILQSQLTKLFINWNVDLQSLLLTFVMILVDLRLDHKHGFNVLLLVSSSILSRELPQKVLIVATHADNSPNVESARPNFDFEIFSARYEPIKRILIQMSKCFWVGQSLANNDSRVFRVGPLWQPKHIYATQFPDLTSQGRHIYLLSAQGVILIAPSLLVRLTRTNAQRFHHICQIPQFQASKFVA